MVTPAPDHVSLLDLTPDQLTQFLADRGQPAYRAGQIYQWLHQKGVVDPRRMSNLPAALREDLAAQFHGYALDYTMAVTGSDGTIKYAWLAGADAPVEAVLMPGFDYGTTLCVSCQSGCPLDCAFCQTGRLGLRSQLTAGQMLTQVYEAEERSGHQVDRLVFMGMGEPLLNLREVRQAIDVLMSLAGREWSPRRISVSTIGLVKPMIEMARGFPRVNLALSLHFTTAEKRQRYMPKGEADTNRLAEALAYYRQVNGGKVTVEYALMQDLNDSDRDVRRLAKFARLEGLDETSELMIEVRETPEPPRQQPLPLHVNLIAYNPTSPRDKFQPSSEARVNEFAVGLRDLGIPVTVRHSRGTDIMAACGQLGSQLLK